jgi:hypothetical protein
MGSAMRGKAAWACSARAFAASQNPRLPRLLAHACVRAGVVCFWTALALEGRAVAAWHEQNAANSRLIASARHRQAAEAPRRWAERMKQWLGLGGVQWVAVPAWSLPDSPKMRSLGLGRMWAVLCPFCNEFHTHSPGEVGRTPHCCDEHDRRRYQLEFAGLLPVEHRTRFYRSSKSGLPRLLHHWPETGLHRSEAIGLLAA